MKRFAVRAWFEVRLLGVLLREIFWYPNHVSHFETDAATRTIRVTREKVPGGPF